MVGGNTAGPAGQLNVISTDPRLAGTLLHGSVLMVSTDCFLFLSPLSTLCHCTEELMELIVSGCPMGSHSFSVVCTCETIGQPW
jgi:hypothetical protein